MPLRVIVCFAAIIVLAILSWRRSWFIGACGAMVLMSLVEHPEMPRTMFGIPGFSPWNFLIINVVFAWLNQRRYEDLVWDMPRNISVLLFFFIGTIFFSLVRLLINPTQYCPFDTAGILNEGFVNSLKFMLPFYIFYDGCRTRQRSVAVVAAILAMYCILGLMVVKHMGLHGIDAGQDLNGRGAKLVHASTGYHRVDMAMMLAGASWGMFACVGLVKSKWHKMAVFGAFLCLSLGEALTGGRTGYVTWCLIGLLLCVLRWRRMLPVLAVGVMIALCFMPAVVQRMSMGFGATTDNIIVNNDSSRITSGRTEVWPYALRGISESPLLGYGRMGFLRSGLAAKYVMESGDEEEVASPHDAYLEMLLDNGVIGFVLVVPIYAVLLFYSLKLFMDRSDRLTSTVGALSLSLFLALLIGSIGAQTLYPREGVAGMWAAAGLMLRRYVDRQRQTQESEEYVGHVSGAYAENA
jgi:O-antigen ligase